MCIVTLATIFWYVLRIFVFAKTEYETEKIPTVATFVEQIPNLRYMPSAMYFKFFAKHHLWPMFATFFISWLFLLKMKQWLYFIFLPCFSLAFLILILITYHKGESPLMYENYYTLFGVFAAITLVFVMEKQFKNHWKLYLIVPLLTISVTGIYNAHAVLTKRVDYLERLVDYGRKQKNKKFLISDKNFPWQVGWVNWSVPFETTLLSAIDGRYSVVTCYVAEDINMFDSIINTKNIFLGPKWAVTWFQSHHLNKKHFHFPSTGYTKLNTSQADTTFNEADFNNKNILIKPLNEIVYSDADTFIVTPIRIINLSEKILASTPDGAFPVYLCYRIYNDMGAVIIPNGKRTTLEVDIVKEYVQGLNVTLPKKKGRYTVEIDLVTESKRWWKINSNFVLVVD